MDTSQAVTLQQSLPLFHQQFSFYVSLFTAAISLALLIRGITLANKVEIHLTKDVFLRVAPFGESLYVHSVSISTNGSSLIKNAFATLEKTSGAKKQFDLKIHMVGSNEEKGILGDYKLLSSSPLDILETDKTKSRLFVFVLSNYSDKIQMAINRYDEELLIKKPLIEQSEHDQTTRNALFLDLYKFRQTLLENIKECLQVEEGEYILTLFIDYEQKMRHLPLKSTKRTNSSIRFKIDSRARSQIIESTSNYLNLAGLQVLTNQPVTAPLPTYIPQEREEIHDR